MRSLRNRFLSGIALQAAVLSGCTGIILVTIEGQKTDSVVINLAGAQRMLSQRISKDALILLRDPGRQTPIRDSIARFDRVLRGLIQGDAELGLPPCEDDAARAALMATSDIWTPFRDAVSAIANGSTDAANINAVLQNNKPLLESADKAVKALELRAKAKVTRIQWAQGISLVVLLGTMAILWWRVQAPLVRYLAETSEVVARGAHEVNNAAHELASASSSIADGACQQTGTLDTTSASADEVSKLATAAQQITQSVATASRESSERAMEATRALDQAVAALHDIDATSSKVQGVVKLIEGIAFQTNLLALNAAVEAARAGESGQGFAVVADEVRTLAQRCAEAAHNTAGLIEASAAASHVGTSRVDEVSTLVKALVHDANRIHEGLEEVNASARTRLAGVAQIAEALSTIGRVTQSNTAAAEEAAATAHSLEHHATELDRAATNLRQLVHGV